MAAACINSCYRSCAHGQSLLCLQLRADEAEGSIQWKMTLSPRLCVKTADNSDKSYWKTCQHYNIQVLEKWYEHEPATVTENKEATILWTMQIHR